MRRTLVITLLLFVGVVLGSYLASPWLLTRAVQSAAATSGVTDLTIHIERPGLDHVLVRNVQLSSAGSRLTGKNARIAYTVAGLLQGRLTDVRIEELALVVAEAEGASSNGTDLSPDLLFPVLPVASINVDRLRLEVPALAFLCAGTLRWTVEDLSLSLDGIAPEAASRFALDATLSSAGQFNVRFSESAADRGELLRAVGRVEANRLALSGQVDLRGFAQSLVSAVAGLPEGEGSLRGAFEATLPWPPAADFGLQDLNGTLEDAALNWRSAADDLALDLFIDSLVADGGAVEATISGAADVTREGLRGRLALPAGYALNFREGILSGADGPELEVVMDNGELSATVQQFILDPDAALPVTFAAEVTANAERLQLAGRLAGQVAPAAGDLTYAGELVALDVKKSGEVSARYQVAGDAVAVTGELSVSQVQGAAFDVSYDLSTQAGSVDVTHNFAVEKPLAASLLPGWEAPYDIDSGVLDVTAQASWRTFDKLSSRVRVVMEGVAARYDDYLAADVRGTLDLSTEDLAEANWQLASTPLNAGTVDVGFPIEDLQMTVAGNLETLRFSDVSARLLGGRARAAPFDYTLSTGDAQIALTLEALDLAAVLALEGEDVSGSGTLEGTLPVTLRDNTVSMQNGEIRALAPGGTIRLSPSLARGTGQPGLDFALVALQDFRFSALTGNIDYAESGDMVLAVQLRGNNPAVEQGRAIEYNLNITENLPTLLESLRLQDEVQTRIECKLNQ